MPCNYYNGIGAGKLLRGREILGVFDMDGREDSEVNRDFLRAAEKSGRTETAGADLPRTFILTDDGIVFTHISSAAVVGRAGKIKNSIDNSE